MQFQVSHVSSGKAEICRAVLEDLPEWFGIPEAVHSYVVGADRLDMRVAHTTAGNVAGFLSIKHHTPVAAEAFVLGVKRRWHRQGCGKALFKDAETSLRDQGIKFLTVKTLAATNPDPNYYKTRKFYEAVGFEPLEVFPTLWDQANPCLLMLKTL